MLLSAAWTLRCRRCSSGRQFGPADVAAAFVADVRRLVRADWQRVVADVIAVAGTDPSWFRGRKPGLSPEEFEARWCAGGVIARCVPSAPGAVPSLELRLVAPAGLASATAAAGPSGA